MDGAPVAVLGIAELWALARVDLGLADVEFLGLTPAALELLLNRGIARDRKVQFHAATIAAAIYNVNNDWEKRPQGWTPADFMPGAGDEEAEDMRTFIEQAERGDPFDVDPGDLAAFKARVEAKVTPPRGAVYAR